MEEFKDVRTSFVSSYEIFTSNFYLDRSDSCEVPIDNVARFVSNHDSLSLERSIPVRRRDSFEVRFRWPPQRQAPLRLQD